MSASSSSPTSDRELNIGIEALRVIAVSMVLIQHMKDYFGPPVSWMRMIDWLPTWGGVDLFLAVSGYVVTSSLIKTGPTPSDIRPFFIRRAFRLLPAAWFWAVVAYVVFAFVATRMKGLDPVLLGKDLAAATTMTMNFYVPWCGKEGVGTLCGQPLALSIFWSLGLEWQFYAVLPFLLLLPRRHVVMVCILAVLTLAVPTRLDSSIGWATRYDALFLGTLVAIAQETGALARLRLSVPVRGAIVAFAVAGLCVVAGPRGNWILAHFKLSIMAVLSTVALLAGAINVSSDRGFSGRSAIEWIGSRSYSIYLAHMPVFAIVREVARIVEIPPGVPFGLSFALLAAIGVLFTLAMADLSYRFLETPLRRYGRSFSSRKAAVPA